MRFESIPGRFELKQQLIRGVETGKVPHAQLFTESSGSGGLALALGYAQYLFCSQKGENDSCGTCSSCLKVNKMIHPDLHFSFPFGSSKKEDLSQFFLQPWRQIFESNPFFTLENWIEALSLDNKMVNIPISECRQIIKELSLKAYFGGYQILILWLPEFLKESAGALLKLLEEPSPGTLFILVTENRDAILPTLLSRTQQISISPLSLLEMEGYLSEKYGVDTITAKTISFLSEGNLSKAASLVLGSANQFEEIFGKWFELLKEGNGLKLVDWVEGFNGKSQKSSLNKEEKKQFLLFSLKTIQQKFLHPPDRVKPVNWTLLTFQNMVLELEKAVYHLERNSNPKILFLDVSLQLSLLLRSEMN